MKKIIDYIISLFPFLGKYKRFFTAFMEVNFRNRESYSQFQEDQYFLKFFKENNLSKENSIFVDIGAFLPTAASNTYLLYKNGYHGVLIEPNSELASLLQRFRKRDIVFPIGISDRCGIHKFNIAIEPALSSLLNRDNDVNQGREKIYRHEYTPVLTLDQALKNQTFEYISLLSIDVEGINLEVLKGSTENLKKTILLCIEFDDKESLDEYKKYLPTFDLIKTVDCNAIYVNTVLLELINPK